MPKDQKQRDFYWLLDTLDAHMKSGTDNSSFWLDRNYYFTLLLFRIIDDRVRRLDGHQGFIFSWVEDE